MIARERLLAWLAAMVLVVGGVLGGGPTSPALSMFVELIATFLFAIGIAGLIDGQTPRHIRPAAILLCLICAVPLLQLVPIPAEYWNQLPGHAVPAKISQLAGFGGLPRPLSLAPEQTRLSGLALVVPVAIFLAIVQVGPKERDQFLMIVVAFALVSAIFGMFQVAAGGISLGIYPQEHTGYPIGFFANRNHEGDLLLIAIPSCAQVLRSTHFRENFKHLTLISFIIFFSLAVLSTQSRTAALLLPLALGGAVAVWIGDMRDRHVWTAFLILFGFMLVSYVLIRLTPVGSLLQHRFTAVGEDLRPTIWQGSWTAIKSFWPLGSGIGSFVPVYQMFEDLDSVGDSWVNHAHNDYMELFLETGIIGVVLVVGYALVLGLTLLRPISRALSSQRYAAVTIILILLAHSLTDYPLRTFGLLTIFAFANGALFPSRDIFRVRRQGSHPVNPPPAFAS